MDLQKVAQVYQKKIISNVKTKKTTIISIFPEAIDQLRGNYRRTRTRCQICSKLTVKTAGTTTIRRCSGFFKLLLWTYTTPLNIWLLCGLSYFCLILISSFYQSTLLFSLYWRELFLGKSYRCFKFPLSSFRRPRKQVFLFE